MPEIDCAALLEQMTATEQELDALWEEIGDVLEQYEEIDAAIQAVQDQIDALKLERGELFGAVPSPTVTEIGYADEDAAEARIAQIEAEVEDILSRVAELEDQREVLAAMIGFLEGILEDIEEGFSLDDIEALRAEGELVEADEWFADWVDALDNRERYESELVQRQAEYDELGAQVDDELDGAEKLLDERDDIWDAMNNSDEAGEIQDRREQIDADLGELNREIQALRDQRDQLELDPRVSRYLQLLDEQKEQNEEYASHCLTDGGELDEPEDFEETEPVDEPG